MLGDKAFTETEKWMLLLAAPVLVFAFFYHLGIYPLYLEEPRRALIALEMILQDNMWVPTQAGDLYYRKPPLYNWVLIGAYQLFGSYSEWATRFFSVASHLVLAVVTYAFCKKFLPWHIALLIAGSYVLSIDILMFSSTIGEIDLFYSLLTTTSIFLIFLFGEKQRYLALFLSLYLLTGLGFLTKGLSSLPFTAISLLVYFLLTRQWQRLFCWQHVVGILVLFAVCGGYFYEYRQLADVSGWWSTLLNESTQRVAGKGTIAYLQHLITYPVETWKNVLPAAFLLPLVFSKGAITRLRQHRFVWFCVLVFFFNFLIYWVAADARTRYVYPLFPFLIIPLVFLASQMDWPRGAQLLRILVMVVLGAFTLAIPVIFFLGELAFVPHKVAIAISLWLASAALWYAWQSKQVRPYVLTMSLCVVLKLAFSLIVPAIRQHVGSAAADKQLALELVTVTQGEPLYRWGDVRISRTTIFYLERELQHVLYQTCAPSSGGFYLCYPEDVPRDANYLRRVDFDFRGRPIWLIEML